MKNSNRWTILAMVVFLSIVMIGCTNEVKKTKKAEWNYEETLKETSGGFTYHAYVSGDQERCWIYQIDVDPEKGSVKQLEIPSEMDGKEVIKLGNVAESDDTKTQKNIFGYDVKTGENIDGYQKQLKEFTSVVLPDCLKEIEAYCFSGFRYLSSVDLPDGIKRISEGTFYGCRRLKSVKLPRSLSSFQASAFTGCMNLNKISLSSDNQIYEVKDGMLFTKKEQELLFVAAGNQKVEIPEGTTEICKGAFFISNAKTVTIPSSVQIIGSRALENPYITEIRISNDNPSFAVSGQCIYAKEDARLVAAIPNKNGYFYMSNRIKKLDGTFSIAGGDLKVVIVSRNLEEVSGIGFDFNRYDTLKRIYFTAIDPPKVSNVENGTDPLPVRTSVYVPKNVQDNYKEWYEEYDCYDLVDQWKTYNQNDLNRLDEKMNK